MNPHQKPQEDVVGRNPWQDAVIDALVVGHIYQEKHDADPRQALHDLLSWEVQIALDPRVSADAAALYEAGRRDMREAAGKVAGDEAGDIERHHPSSRDSWHQGRAAMAKSIAASIRALPTEPLGGDEP